MNKIRITLEIESKHRNERRTSKLEKLIGAFVRLWKATLASDLHPSAIAKLLRLFVISSALLALAYLLSCILALVINRL